VVVLAIGVFPRSAVSVSRHQLSVQSNAQIARMRRPSEPAPRSI
jgi:hypothetical protein